MKDLSIHSLDSKVKTEDIFQEGFKCILKLCSIKSRRNWSGKLQYTSAPNQNTILVNFLPWGIECFCTPRIQSTSHKFTWDLSNTSGKWVALLLSYCKWARLKRSGLPWAVHYVCRRGDRWIRDFLIHSTEAKTLSYDSSTLSRW